jgi:hypothetical protein
MKNQITQLSTQELLFRYRITSTGSLFYVCDKKRDEKMVAGPASNYREAVEMMHDYHNF